MYANFAEAVVLVFERSETEGQRLRGFRDHFEKRVQATVPKVRINGARAPRVPNTSNLTFGSVDAEPIVLGSDLKGIYVSTGSTCSTGDPEPFHVLLAMGISSRDAQGSIRISFGRSSQEVDIDATVKALQATVEGLRAISSVGGKASSR
jgi:cysteine desulfurase